MVYLRFSTKNKKKKKRLIKKEQESVRTEGVEEVQELVEDEGMGEVQELAEDEGVQEAQEQTSEVQSKKFDTVNQQVVKKVVKKRKTKKMSTKNKKNLKKIADIEKTPEYEKSKEELLTEAIRLHDAGVDGDKEAVLKAYDLLQKLHALDPKDPVIEGYYGCAITLLGRDAVDPNERFANAMKGLKILDRVVEQHPDIIEIRTLRAFTCYRLPEMYFHRTSTAIEDFNYLLSRYEENNSVFSEDFYWQILYDLGQAYKNIDRQEEAGNTWSKLVSLTPESKYQELLEGEELLTGEAAQIAEAPAVEDRDDELQAPPTSQNVKKKQGDPGVELHLRALSGDKTATEKAFDYYSKAHQANRKDQLIAAYYADCMSMKGRDAKDPKDLFANAIKAMKELDNCVNREPDNIQIRLLRANQSFRLPEAFFRRTLTAIEDFKYFIRRYEKDNSVFAQETYWQILFDLGSGYKRLDMEKEAQETWQKLLALKPDPKYQGMIAKQKVRSMEDVKKKLSALSSKDRLLEEGKRLHYLGVEGNKEAVKLAYEALKKAHEMNPDDPVALGYYGSALALTGRDATDTSEMFGNSIKGLVTLKKAIGRNWNNPELRLLRGYLVYSLPEAFFQDLTEVAVKDFKFVKTAYEKGQGDISKETYWQVLYDLGVCYRRAGDEKNCKKIWSRLLKKSTDLKYKSLVNIDG